MSTAPRYVPHYTIEDYAQWEGDWELIDGVPIAMSPSPFGPHERIVSRLSFQIQSQIESKSCPCMIYTNLDWIISNDTVIRPDLMVVCGDQPDRHLEHRPEVVVEVLSESSRGRDLTAKRTLVRENEVPHYLIIDPAERSTLHIIGHEESNHDSGQTIELIFNNGDCKVQVQCSRLFD